MKLCIRHKHYTMAPQGKLTKPKLLALLLKLQNKGELSNTKLAWEVKKTNVLIKFILPLQKM